MKWLRTMFCSTALAIHYSLIAERLDVGAADWYSSSTSIVSYVALENLGDVEMQY